jgi:cysteine desulfurase
MLKFPIYLDNNSTTQLDPEVFETMKPYLLDKFGNASSKSHSFGLEAERAVEFSRKQIAEYIGTSPEEIYFTSGTTESINLAHFGIAGSNLFKGKHIVTSTIEHSAVLESLKALEKYGYEISFADVDKFGRIYPEKIVQLIKKETILVSVMAVNNEIGTIQPIQEIGKICKEKDVLFHIDAAQAIGKMNFNVTENNADLVSFSAHKSYGPKGIGALYIKKRIPSTKLTPIIYGGGQENSLRSGTLNVPAIVGFGKAIQISSEKSGIERPKIAALKERLYKGIISNLDDVYVNGSIDYGLFNTLSLRFEGIHADVLISSMKKIALSTGSACSSGSGKSSHVLKAIGLSDQEAKSSVRFGIGRFNTQEEIDFVINEVTEKVKNLRVFHSSALN